MVMLGLAACGGKAVIDGSAGGGGAGAGTSTSSSTSSSSAIACGGLHGTPCPADSFCDYANDQCGGDDGLGQCAPRQQACDKNAEPTCACDGQVYGNQCAAQQAGFDQNALGGCTPPPGTFGCGAHFCQLGGYYCILTPAGAPATPATYGCNPLPAECGGQASCDCLTGLAVECGGSCFPTDDGGILVTCPYA